VGTETSADEEEIAEAVHVALDSSVRVGGPYQRDNAALGAPCHSSVKKWNNTQTVQKTEIKFINYR
jgi:hypothetical protein